MAVDIERHGDGGMPKPVLHHLGPQLAATALLRTDAPRREVVPEGAHGVFRLTVLVDDTGNLILNAIDAMSTTLPPRDLLVTSVKNEPNGVLVTVRDSGIGLDKKAPDLLFEAGKHTSHGHKYQPANLKSGFLSSNGQNTCGMS